MTMPNIVRELAQREYHSHESNLARGRVEINKRDVLLSLINHKRGLNNLVKLG